MGTYDLQIKIQTMQRCEGHRCPEAVRDTCWRYTASWHPRQPGAGDYSQCPEFKPACARENCRMYLPEPQYGQD